MKYSLLLFYQNQRSCFKRIMILKFYAQASLRNMSFHFLSCVTGWHSKKRYELIILCYYQCLGSDDKFQLTTILIILNMKRFSKLSYSRRGIVTLFSTFWPLPPTQNIQTFVFNSNWLPHIFIGRAYVITRLLLDEIYLPVWISIFLNVNCI